MAEPLKKIAINSQSGLSMDQLVGWTVALLLAHQLKSTAIELLHFCAHKDKEESGSKPLDKSIYLSQQQLDFLDELGITEKQLFIECNACNSLGRFYKDWSEEGQDYAFVEGDYGVNFNNIGFQHYLTLLKKDLKSNVFDQYSLAAVMARTDKFVHPIADERSILSSFRYGVNVNAQQYTQLLRTKALSLGVKEYCDEAPIENINYINEEGGFSVDFLFDCVKQSKVERDETLSSTAVQAVKSPINRVLTANLPLTSQLKTADVFQAYSFGYTKLMQLKNKQVLQCFYHHDTDVDDIVSLLASDGVIVDLAKSEIDSFEQYSVETPWQKNRLLIGHGCVNTEALADNFLDFIHHDIGFWMKNFPRKTPCDSLVNYYNQNHNAFYSHIFDFISVHYLLSQWRLNKFWQSNSHQGTTFLKHLIEMFQQTGVVVQNENQYFTTKQWLNLLMGFNCVVDHYDPLIDLNSRHQFTNKIDTLRSQISQFSGKLPTYQCYLANQNL